MLSTLILTLCLQGADKDLIGILSNVKLANAHRYAAEDDKGAGLDCLKVEQTGSKAYIGVHHTLKNGIFELHLVQSTDLMHWTYLSTIDTHAHQGTISKYGDRWLLAWEKDGPNGNWIHIAGYDNIAALKEGKPAKEFDIPRTLSPAAEGTPNIYSASYPTSWDRSDILIGFHYYRDRDVDRQAVGMLVGFKDWNPMERSSLNTLLEPAYHGNIGDRDVFFYKEKPVTILEAQLKKNDWSSWRLVLNAELRKYVELSIITHGGSTSFANPSVTSLTLPNGQPGLFMSYFLPSQGAAKGEAGELIFYRETNSQEISR